MESLIKRIVNEMRKEEWIRQERNRRLIWKMVMENKTFVVTWCRKCKVGILKRCSKKDLHLQDRIKECWKCDRCGHEEYYC